MKIRTEKSEMAEKKYKQCPFKTTENCTEDSCALWEQLFDMCALKVDGYLKAFDRAYKESRE